MPKTANQEPTYEVVGDEFRRPTATWATSKLMQDLLAGKTIRIDNYGRNNSLYKAVRTAGKRLRSRTDGTATILWLIDEPTEEPLTVLNPESVEETSNV